MKTQLNRRQFLKAASAVALTSPLAVRAAEGTRGRKGPNDRITMGFIGEGTQGGGLFHNFLNQPNTQVLAVCDVDTTRREHHRKVVDGIYSIKSDKAFRWCAEDK